MLERALVNQLNAIHFTTHRNLAGVTHEESLVAPLGGGN